VPRPYGHGTRRRDVQLYASDIRDVDGRPYRVTGTARDDRPRVDVVAHPVRGV